MSETKIQIGDLVRVKDETEKDLYSAPISTRHGYVACIEPIPDDSGKAEITVINDDKGAYYTLLSDSVELVTKRPPIPEQPLPIGTLARGKMDGGLCIVVKQYGNGDVCRVISFVDTLAVDCTRENLVVLDDSTIPALLKKAEEMG